MEFIPSFAKGLRDADEIRSDSLRVIFGSDASVFGPPTLPELRRAKEPNRKRILSAARIGSATFVSLDHAADGAKIEKDIGCYFGSFPKERRVIILPILHNNSVTVAR